MGNEWISPTEFEDHAQNIPLKELVEHWYLLNPHSPNGCTGSLKVFSSLKVPMDLFPALPDFQLQFGQSCALPFVKPSKFDLLGMEEQDIFLTDSTCGGKVVHKVVMTDLPDIERSHVSWDITSLSIVTQFDATRCDLYPGHLEQLAIACPNLQHLNLLGNRHCLLSLQGLHAIFTCCKSLQGLNIVEISFLESYIQLWKILVDMRLTYLAIELCVIIPDVEEVQRIISFFPKCMTLKALEVQHTRSAGRQNLSYDLSVLSKFPSLVHCFVGNIPYEIEVVINSCSKLKYFVHSSYTTEFEDIPITPNESLEQLCIKSAEPREVVVSDAFLRSVSAHGRLVHVALCVGVLFTDGIIALIENSPKLLTCHIYTSKIIESDDTGDITLKDMKSILKQKFSNRKLFTCGSFNLLKSRADKLFIDIENLLIERHTDIFSLWSTGWDTLFRIIEYQL